MTHSSAEADRTERTRELIRARACENGQRRSDGVAARVRAVLLVIENELLESGGVYTRNKGVLSGAEVARRADVHPTTFYSPKQRGLGAEVTVWLNNLLGPPSAAPTSQRRTLPMRVAEWKRLYDGLEQSHRDTELELQQAQAELAQVRATLRTTLEQLDVLKRR
jgi:hypothetical protein